MDGARENDRSEKHRYTLVCVYVCAYLEEWYVHEYISETTTAVSKDICRKLKIKELPRSRVREREFSAVEN